MQFFPSSILVVAAIAILAIQGPRRSFWAFLALTPLAATAAFNLPAVGGASILLADLAAIAIAMLILLRPQGLSMALGTVRVGQPGFWLLLLTLYAIVATMLFPTLFRGDTLVFGIARDGNESGIVSRPLGPSNGNLTQLFRHMLGICVFLAAATLFRLQPDPRPALFAVSVTTGLHAILGWLDVATFATGLSALMEPFRTANYAILFEHRMVGLKRMIGGFPEASSFGFFSLGLFGFWLHYWLNRRGDRLGAIMLFLMTIAVLRSTSSAAYVGLLAFLGLYATVAILSSLTGDVSRRGARIVVMSGMGLWLGGVAAFAAYEMVEPVQAFLDRALFDKLEGDSGVERFSWNAQAMINFFDTKGLGAGLGSVRASGWPFAVLASLGVLGAACYALFLGSLLMGPGSWRSDLPQATVADSARVGCVAFLVVATLTAATPDLGLAFYAFAGIAAGLTRGGLLNRAQMRADAR